MSSENVELVRRGIADVHDFWAMLDEYVVWDLRGKGSGVEIDRCWGQTWTFQRGRIIRWEMFRDKEAALAALISSPKNLPPCRLGP